MEQEDKQLLLQDLCARLPYGVKVQHQREDYFDEIQTIERISRQYGEIETESVLGFVDDFKPYLRPMSSMTEEEKEELNCLCYHNIDVQDEMLCGYICANEMNDVIDWLNKHHFDYRNLIEKGLAIAVTEENNPYKD